MAPRSPLEETARCNGAITSPLERDSVKEWCGHPPVSPGDGRRPRNRCITPSTWRRIVATCAPSWRASPLAGAPLRSPQRPRTARQPRRHARSKAERGAAQPGHTAQDGRGEGHQGDSGATASGRAAGKCWEGAIQNSREFVAAGGLMSYGTRFPDLWRRAATYVDKLLKGAKMADLPVEHPMQFELVVNLKTTQSLGPTLS